MRVAVEHPRLASAIASALILLALAAAAAGSALGGNDHRNRTSSTTVRLALARTAGLVLQLRAAEAQDEQLRGEVRTLRARVDRLPRPRRCRSHPTPTTHGKRGKP